MTRIVSALKFPLIGLTGFLFNLINGFGGNVSANNSNSTVLVHPLFDEPEEKLDVDKLGKLKLTRGGRLSLMALQVYLVLMLFVSIYRTMELAGVIK
jgi:hypothetical protein